MKLNFKLSTICILFIINILTLNASEKQSIIEQEQPVAIDTAKKFGVASETSTFTREQDSIYRLGLKLNIPFMVKAYSDYLASEPIWQLWKKNEANRPWNLAASSFDLMPATIFNPTGEEIVQRQISMINALSIPGVYSFAASAAGVGTVFDLYKVGVFLGIFEDVSPTIKYKLTITADVEIVIYSMQAKVIATIFKGTQAPGSYSITWNGRDDNGKKMEMGDYFAEVKIASDRFERKRIRIGDYK